MFFVDLLFAFIIALVLAVLLVGVFGWRHPGRPEAGGAGAFVAFLTLFLLIWAIGVWFEPFGPMVWGGFWAPFLIVGVLLFLFLLAVAPPRPRRRVMTPTEAAERQREAEATTAVFGAFFWILIIAAVVALLVSYW